ncbi:transcription termination factor NusA [Brachyspira hyodysenteriae]|uniref:transcription termination factor NusA n=1 Tax=Brachyspira hyodysenteriae TaxID=159 RepID=UPI00063DA8AE|nr:transcription termination factor NusA [Brachyspira hyodysenteriae]KLI25045.1 transcription elongation factor NusA [Brachyspira hyodysenteriae]KLI35138.1 transcription elongation factor NusA [Brachyspira hyodysenteriae]MDA0156270.1 transcription termination factor NusA [Brachyspira hyodysenteriae]TVL76252.1 transcription termination/antitermination protein NusA [Brachyspira hyodysenteriae]TVL81092.1 transcription termination/antitermination protein NusA [Brachyspira hyodysenteriae]
MFENVGTYLQQLSDEKDISVELLKEVIASTMELALKKKYGDDIKFHIHFDNKNNPTVYKGASVVEEVRNKNKEISLEEAKKLDQDINLGDEVLILVDQVEAFGRIESTVARTAFFQKISELEKNIIYNEFKRRENQLVNGYFQREHRGTIYINLGKTEGELQKKDQSPREHYTVGDRIRAYIYKVQGGKDEKGKEIHTKILLTRTKPDFIKKLFELEIPEIADGTIEIKNVVRQPGLKIKVAVASNKPEVDPIGACIGQKGIRIQSIIKEIEGEKIDVVKWSKDIREYIAEAITPAKPIRIIITDPEKKEAMIIIPDEQLSLALGKSGYNVKLASQLTGYYFDIKTETDIKENPELLKDIVPLNQIFSDNTEEVQAADEELETAEVFESNLYSLQGIDEAIIKTLIDNNINSIEELYNMSVEDIMEKTDLERDIVDNLMLVMKDVVEVVEASDDEYETTSEEVVEEIEVYECPNCGSSITEDMTKCPKCGIELSFE